MNAKKKKLVRIIKMDKNKARLILYYSYESYKNLMLMVSAVKKIEKEVEHLPIKKETILKIAGKIAHGVHFELYKQFDEFKDELDYLEEIRKKNEMKLIKDVNTETFIYLSLIAFKKLGGTLIPDFFDEKNVDDLESEIKQVILEESEKIIKEIINPLLKTYPDIKEEIDLSFSKFIKFI